MRNTDNKNTYLRYGISAFLMLGAVMILLLAGKLSAFTAVSVFVLYYSTASGTFEDFFLPAAAAAVAECSMQLMITGEYLPCIDYRRVLDLILYFLIFYSLHQVIPGKFKGIASGIFLFIIVGTVNFLVTYYRGRPVYYPDLYSAATAANIISLKGYTFPLSRVYLLSLILMAAVLIALTGNNDPKKNRPCYRRLMLGAMPLLLIFLFCVFRFPDLLHFRSYYFSTTDYWMYSFAMSGYSMHAVRPKGYDSHTVPLSKKSDGAAIEQENLIQPNILVIVNHPTHSF